MSSTNRSPWVAGALILAVCGGEPSYRDTDFDEATDGRASGSWTSSSSSTSWTSSSSSTTGGEPDDCDPLPDSSHPKVSNDPFDLPVCQGTPRCPPELDDDKPPGDGRDDDGDPPEPPKDEHGPCECYYSDGAEWKECPKPTNGDTIQTIECRAEEDPVEKFYENCDGEMEIEYRTCKANTDGTCSEQEGKAKVGSSDCADPVDGMCLDIDDHQVVENMVVKGTCEPDCQYLEAWNFDGDTPLTWRWVVDCKEERENVVQDVHLSCTYRSGTWEEGGADPRDGRHIRYDCFHTPEDEGADPDLGNGLVCQGSCDYSETPAEPWMHPLLQEKCPPHVLDELDPCSVTIEYTADCREEAPTPNEGLPEEYPPEIEGLPPGCF